MYTVFVRGLEFYAYHGVSNEEQAVGHRYEASMEAVLEGSADRTDDVSDTVSYADIADIVVRTATSARHRTVERLAGEILSALLRELPAVQRVEIDLAKRLPPFPQIAREAGVRMARERDPE